MAARGMGAVYTKLSTGEPLRVLSHAERRELMATYYEPHHAMLEKAVAAALSQFGHCLIIDIHSFSSMPLPHELDQSVGRPEICIVSLVARHRRSNVPQMSRLRSGQTRRSKSMQGLSPRGGRSGSRLGFASRATPCTASAFVLILRTHTRCKSRNPYKGPSHSGGVRALVSMELSASNERLDFAFP